MSKTPYRLDYNTLEGLCKLQCTGEECASVLGIDYETLNTALHRDNHGGFVEYLKTVGAGGRASLRRLQWKSAQSGNVTMQIWLGKQYLEQKDVQIVNGGIAQPLDISFEVREKVKDIEITRGKSSEIETKDA